MSEIFASEKSVSDRIKQLTNEALALQLLSTSTRLKLLSYEVSVNYKCFEAVVVASLHVNIR